MYDTITINVAMLPVTEKDRKRLEGQHFQTKSLDESLQHYRITDDGMLETDWDMLWWELNNYTWGKPRTEESVPPEENWEVVKITDSIHFYTHTENNRDFFEFVAFFELGKMLIIRKLIDIDTVKSKIKRKSKT
ncbi:hypothetical protein [Arcicella aurantiaca]|nr:hypothetical protein [Arcicella aurantiaca]